MKSEIIDPAAFDAAAKAIFDVRDDQFDLDEWEDLDATQRERYECDARAALSAYRAALPPTVLRGSDALERRAVALPELPTAAPMPFIPHFTVHKNGHIEQHLAFSDGPEALFTVVDLQNFRAIVESGTPLARNTVLRLIENAQASAPAAQPVVNSVEELVMTRAGLALANTAFEEGLSAGIRACNATDDGAPFKKPVSPYSAPLLAIIKADRPEADDA